MFAYLRGAIALLFLPHQPNRVEPQAVKRRPKPRSATLDAVRAQGFYARACVLLKIVPLGNDLFFREGRLHEIEERLRKQKDGKS